MRILESFGCALSQELRPHHVLAHAILDTPLPNCMKVQFVHNTPSLFDASHVWKLTWPVWVVEIARQSGFWYPFLDLLVTETLAKLWFRSGSDFLGFGYALVHSYPFVCSIRWEPAHTHSLGFIFSSVHGVLFLCKGGSVRICDCSHQSEYSLLSVYSIDTALLMYHLP